MLSYHIKKVHTKEKPFGCPGCGKHVVIPAHWKRNQWHGACPLTLAPERNTQNTTCVVCREEFKSVRLMHKHERERFGKFMTCCKCEKMFENAEELTKHLEMEARGGLD